MLAVKFKKIRKAQGARLHPFEIVRHPIPLVAPRRIDSVTKDQRAEQERRKREYERAEDAPANGAFKSIPRYFCARRTRNGRARRSDWRGNWSRQHFACFSNGYAITRASPG